MLIYPQAFAGTYSQIYVHSIDMQKKEKWIFF